jgi:hypothetical protein
MNSKLQAILTGMKLTEWLPYFVGHKIDDSILSEITDSDLKELGFSLIGDRKRLLLEFQRAARPGFAAKQRTQAIPAAGRPPDPVRSRSAQAVSKQNPFRNSLGMPFVPVPRCKILLCIWQVRVADYAVFCAETGATAPVADFPQDGNHPVSGVSWDDCQVFCDWLTKREVATDTISDSSVYRLPDDEEWSAAVGLVNESGSSPKSRSGVVEGYPWEGAFPPSARSGNYHSKFGCGFPETSPVGSFPPNRFGICDLGGNVWEWCMDLFAPGSPDRVLRGAACFNDDPLYLMSSFRDHLPPEKSRNNVGFRIALATCAEADPWHQA